MLNMDYSQELVIDTTAQDWVASPMAGVWRKPLAREEAERGHATSIVRYEPGASFSAHNHPGGEEILVLEGIFSDQTGDYPAGTYFRNPVGFRHAPFSAQGCILLVKLHQFQDGDEKHVVIDTNAAPTGQVPPGWQTLPLHSHGSEQVRLLRHDPRDGPSGESPETQEVYVLAGEVSVGAVRHRAGTWLRGPRPFRLVADGDAVSVVWIKSGHLPA